MLWDEEDIFGSLMKNLKITGLLHENNFTNKLKARSYFVLMTILTLYYILNLFIPSEFEEHGAHIFETVFSFMTVLAKAGTFIYYQKEFKMISNNRKQFWPLDLMGTSLGSELKKIRRICSKGFKIYCCMATGVFIALFINAAVFKEMPFPCWIPEGNTWSIGIIAFQLILLLYLIFTVTSFDFMFTIAYLEVYFQFRLLNTAFSRTETVRDIEKCQLHQHFLFEYVKIFNKVYSCFLLVQYFSTISSSCMLIVQCLDDYQTFGNKMASLFHFVAEVVQMAFFCFGPSLVRDESEKTLTSIWECNWYQKKLNFQKYILFILTVSSSELSITASGLIEINRELFLNVFKTTFSVYTLIKATKES